MTMENNSDNHGWYAYLWARDVLGHPSKEVERQLYDDPIAAYYYTRDILHGERFIEAEPYIKTNPEIAKSYNDLISRVSSINLAAYANSEIDLMDADIFLKQAFIRHMPGHKDSGGNAAPWVIISHETGKILGSFSTRAKAAKQLQYMHIFKK